MKRKLDDNMGLWLKDAVVGQFQIIEKDGKEQEKVLVDNNRNIYQLHTVSILSPQFSRYEGTMEFPKPFRVKADGTIIETGAKVLIIFPMGKTNPIVLGCINRLGAQNKNVSALQLESDNLRRKKKRTFSDDNGYEKIEDEDGIKQVVSGGGYGVSVKGGNITMESDNFHSIEGKQQLNLLGKIIEIGGNTDRVTKVPDDNIKNKADNIYLYGKEVIIGHSNKRGKKIKQDKPKTIDEPILQPMLMGITVEALWDLFIDIMMEAKYTGSGVIQMMPSSVLELKKRVKLRLPKIKSKVGFILYDPEQFKGEEDN